MNKTRVIPVLLLRGKGLVKTVKFKDPKYIGDPINSVRIFNEKEVDELVFKVVGEGVRVGKAHRKRERCREREGTSGIEQSLHVSPF